jgi:hypothetical protein
VAVLRRRAALRRPACARGGGGEVVREKVRLGLAFYRAEGEGEKAVEVVARAQWPAAING